MNIKALLVVFFAMTALSSATASAQVYYFQRNNPIFESPTLIYLNANQSIKLETRNLSLGADTVLRFYKQNATTSSLGNNWTQVAVNDDSGGTLASVINYVAPSAGWYRAVVHSFAKESSGTMSFYINNNLSVANAPFGGIKKSVSLAPGETISTAFAAGGVYAHQMLVYEGTNQTSDFLIIRNPGYALNRREYLGIDYKNITSSTKSVTVIFSGKFSIENENIKLIQNNPYADTDGDGLGDVLETAPTLVRDGIVESSGTGTCYRTNANLDNGKTCSDINPIDTDNDGLTDKEEVYGAIPNLTCTGGSCNVDGAFPAPLWGSNPAKKDIFVQVDVPVTLYEPDAYGNYNGPPNMGGRFDQTKADDIAAAYLSTNSMLNNKTSDLGVSLHLDISGSNFINSEMSGNSYPGAFYSSGYAKVFDNTNANVFDNSVTPCWPISGNRVDLVLQRMNPIVKKYSKYYCIGSWNKNGGQALHGWHGASGGGGAWALTHELAHSYRLSHAGRPDQEYNAKPNYISLMNYAYNVKAMSNGLNTTILNPYNVSELNFYDNDLITRMSGYLWRIPLVSNKLDFDHDGVITSSPLSYPVQWSSQTKVLTGFLNSEAHGVLRAQFDTDIPINIDATPSVARINYSVNLFGLQVFKSKVYAFYISNGFLKYKNMDVSTDGECLTLNYFDKSGNKCGVFSSYFSVPTSVNNSTDKIYDISVDSQNFNGREHLYMVVRYSLTRANGRNFAVWRAEPDLNGVLVNWTEIPISGTTAYNIIKPIIRRANNTLVMVVPQSPGTMRYYTNDVGSDTMVHRGYITIGINGGNLLSGGASITYNPNENNIYMAIKDSSGRLRVYNNNSINSTQFLESTHLQGNLPDDVRVSRYFISELPGIVWLPHRHTTPNGAGYLLVLINKSDDGISYAFHLHPGITRWGYFHNEWSDGVGKDISYRAGDKSPKMISSYDQTSLTFYTHPDGRFNYGLKDFDDFKVLYSSVCDTIGGAGRAHCLPPRSDVGYTSPLPNGLSDESGVFCDLK